MRLGRRTLLGGLVAAPTIYPAPLYEMHGTR